MLFLIFLNIFITSKQHGLVRMNSGHFNLISRDFLSKYSLAVLLAVVSTPALAVDTDGDGHVNFCEYKWDTNPRNPVSYPGQGELCDPFSD